jgi:hypothetical protein
MSSRKKKTAAAAAKVEKEVDVDEALNGIDELWRSLNGEANAAGQAVQAATAQLKAAERRSEFVASKIRRVHALLRGGDGDLQRILNAGPHDDALLALLKKSKPATLEAFKRTGATNDQILAHLHSAWKPYDYSGHVPRGVGGYSRGEAYAFLDPAAPNRATYEKAELVAEVRRVLGIPQPTASAKPAAKATAKKGGGSGGTSRPSRSRRRSRPAKRAAPAAPPPKADDDADAIEAGGTYTPEQLGIADGDGVPYDPNAALSWDLVSDAPGKGGLIGDVVEVDGNTYATVRYDHVPGAGLSPPRMKYTLHPVCRPDQWTLSRPETWTERRRKHDDAELDAVPLAGLLAKDPAGDEWVLGREADCIFCVAPVPKVLGNPRSWQEMLAQRTGHNPSAQVQPAASPNDAAGPGRGEPPKGKTLSQIKADDNRRKREEPRLSGKTRAQWQAILTQTGTKELQRKRELHAPLCPSDAPRFDIIRAILDRMFSPSNLANAGTPAAAATQTFNEARAAGKSVGEALNAGTRTLFDGGGRGRKANGAAPPGDPAAIAAGAGGSFQPVTPNP